MSRAPRITALAALVWILYLFGLTRMGLAGPDEPRYASIGREMARSGDWITPRLWGEPWFEKPVLIYWMSGAGFRLGLPPELAVRLPVALVSIAFLVLYQRILARQAGPRAAWFATAILGTSAGWLAYSHVGATDLPMAAAFSAAMLLSLEWLERGESRRLPVAAAMLGAAVLAKGLVPLVLALPLMWAGRRRWRDLLRPSVLACFAAVALPWYLLCWIRNGTPFLRTFFWEHHFGRFASGALQHTQPFWFYVPVLLAALLPWTPVLALIRPPKIAADPRRRFLLAWLLFGLVFFSASANKLPGYLLPLLPAAAALAGIALAERGARGALAAVAVGLVAIPMGIRILPPALASGITRAGWPRPEWTWLAPLAMAAIVWRLEPRKAVALLTAATAAGVLWLKIAVFPAIDTAVSARPIWREIEPHRDDVCVAAMHRSWRYGLNFYSVTPLPDCSRDPKPWAVEQSPGRPPVLKQRYFRNSS